jgi:hypothetical protein
MNHLIKKIAYKLRSAKSFVDEIRYRRIFRFLQKTIVLESKSLPIETPNEWSLTYSELKTLFVCKDESWNHVKQLKVILNRRRYFLNTAVIDNDCSISKVIFGEHCLFVEAPRKQDNWVYCILKYDFGNQYLLNFNVTLQTCFHEFQLAFMHRSLFERYRFRVVDNISLDFEIVGKGYFFHKILSVPFSFEIGKCHNIKLIIAEAKYQFIVDNQVVLTVSDAARWYNSGELALIFYDWEGKDDIRLKIENMYFCGAKAISKYS